MSLRQFGNARSPTRCQLTSKGSEESPGQELAQHNRDVLIERVKDLVNLLSQSDDYETGAMTEIHSKVDQIEEVLRGNKKPPKSSTSSASSTSPRGLNQEQQTSPSKAVQIANEAENLAASLARTVAEFRKRREEADHVSRLLVERAEVAAQLASSFEEQLEELEDDQEASQSELKYLRIQLQAIEVQSSQFMVAGGDPDLTQSIKNWKAEWEMIDKRTKERKNKLRISADSTTPSYSHTSTRSRKSLDSSD